jgi:hypothetical protein
MKKLRGKGWIEGLFGNGDPAISEVPPDVRLAPHHRCLSGLDQREFDLGLVEKA